MEFTMGAGGVPAGNYYAEFVGVAPFTENAERFGEGVLLKWRVIGGEQNGQEASRICSKKVSPKSNLAKFAVALKGAPILTGERFSLDAFVGVRGQIIVEPTESGGSRVNVFLREQPSVQPVQPQQPFATPPVQPQTVQQPIQSPGVPNGGQPPQQATERF